MQTMFIVHTPGWSPRIGYPTGDPVTSLREWQERNPGAAIYVVQAQDLPAPGTASVDTAASFIAMEEATAGAALDEDGDGG